MTAQLPGSAATLNFDFETECLSAVHFKGRIIPC